MDVNSTQSDKDHLNDAKMTKLYEDENIFNQKHERKGFGSKFRTMSDKTHKLFSRFYSNSNLKSSVIKSSSDITEQQNSTKIANSRRSLSYGTLTQVNEFNTKKLETEDCDSGILIESGALSIRDENSDINKHKINQDEIFQMPHDRKYVQRIEIKYDHEDINEEQENKPKLCSSSFNKHLQHNASYSILPLTSTPFIEKEEKDRLSDSGLNDANVGVTTKRNSVLDIVTMLERNDNSKKFNTLNHPKRSIACALAINQEDSYANSSALNMCDDDKLKLKSAQSKEKFEDDESKTHLTQNNRKVPSSNFCTLPRKVKTTPHCTFHKVIFEKGYGKKALGFTIVGGADSPRGALGIFIKSILPKGQAFENGLLKAGDEILAVNGNVCHDLTHQDAIKLFKSVRSGEIVLNICRRRVLVAVT